MKIEVVDKKRSKCTICCFPRPTSILQPLKNDRPSYSFRTIFFYRSVAGKRYEHDDTKEALEAREIITPNSVV